MDIKVDPDNLTNDHDVLTENTILLKELTKHFANHLRHHFAITCIALTAAAIGAANFVVGVLMIVMSLKS